MHVNVRHIRRVLSVIYFVVIAVDVYSLYLPVLCVALFRRIVA